MYKFAHDKKNHIILYKYKLIWIVLTILV